MTSTPFPTYPALPSLRLANAGDLSGMSEVSVLGFKDSEIFRYERPQYEEFPQGSVSSFCKIYRSQLLDPRAVVIATEDWQRLDEDSLCPSDQTGGPELTSRPAKRVVVGAASWVLPEGSPRTGQFVVSDVSDPEPALNRDLDQRRLDIFTGIAADEEKK